MMVLSKPANCSSVLSGGSALTTGYSDFSTIIDTSNALQVAAEVVVTTAAGITAMGRLEVFASIDTDGTTWTTKPYASYDLVLEANATSRQTWGIINAPRYLKFRVYNASAQTMSAIGINVSMQTMT